MDTQHTMNTMYAKNTHVVTLCGTIFNESLRNQ